MAFTADIDIKSLVLCYYCTFFIFPHLTCIDNNYLCNLYLMLKIKKSINIK